MVVGWRGSLGSTFGLSDPGVKRTERREPTKSPTRPPARRDEGIGLTQLLDPTRWQSHGQMISWSDAAHESIGLTVEYLLRTSAE
jgi:hypothetical protein